MKPSRFSEEQIIGMLKEQGGGFEDRRYLPEVRDIGATFYKFQGQYGGMDVSDARRLKALEDENARLKKLLANRCSTIAILKDVASKKW